MATDVELRPQVYRDPRPPEYFAPFHQRVRAREPDAMYEVARVLTVTHAIVKVACIVDHADLNFAQRVAQRIANIIGSRRARARRFNHQDAKPTHFDRVRQQSM